MKNMALLVMTSLYTTGGGASSGTTGNDYDLLDGAVRTSSA